MKSPQFRVKAAKTGVYPPSVWETKRLTVRFLLAGFPHLNLWGTLRGAGMPEVSMLRLLKIETDSEICYMISSFTSCIHENMLYEAKTIRK